MIAIDTNILVYSFDVDEKEKCRKATELLDRLSFEVEEAVILWQVAVEFIGVLKRWQNQGEFTHGEILRSWNLVSKMFPIVMPKGGIVQRAFDLGSRYSLSHWDSLLLAACIEAGVTTLYSEDLSAGVKYDSVTVINPFI